jgi:uncharacterized membrane protein YhaH (DUF805 family)
VVIGPTHVVDAVGSPQAQWIDGGVAGDLFTFLIIAVILVAFCVTTAMATTRSLNDMRRRGWPDLAVGCAMVGLLLVMFGGGWLVLDAWWTLRAVSRGADRLFAGAD